MKNLSIMNTNTSSYCKVVQKRTHVIFSNNCNKSSLMSITFWYKVVVVVVVVAKGRRPPCPIQCAKTIHNHKKII